MILTVKRTFAVLSLLVVTFAAQAQYYNTVNSRCRHFLNLSVGAGVAENLSINDFVSNKIGADGTFAFTYEIQKKFFFFNFGVGLDYMYTRQGFESFTDAYERQDLNGEDIEYRYKYFDYVDGQHTLFATAPIQFGFYLGTYCYLALGAKVGVPFYGSYNTRTNLQTEIEYIRFIEPITKDQPVPEYGVYPEMELKYKAPREVLGNVNVAPTFEIGARLPISLKKKIDCRVGLYAEYHIPVVTKTNTYDLLVYSSVDIDPATQNQENLENYMMFKSIVDARFNETVKDLGGKVMMSQASQYLTGGIRATFRFDVTIPPKYCLICNDHYVPYRTNKKNPKPVKN